MSYLCYLCLFTYGGIQHILCCVYLFLFVLLPVSLDCPFFISSSVFSNVFLIINVLAMRKLTGYEDVEDELDEMKQEARKSQSIESFTIKKLLTTPELRLPIVIACALQAGQQASGINAVSSNICIKHQTEEEEGCRCCDRMVVGFTTTCEISAYHH